MSTSFGFDPKDDLNDLRMSDKLVIGGAFGWTENKGDFGGGGYKLNEATGTFYAGYRDGPWYLAARLGGGDLDFKDVHRNIEIGTGVRVERGSTKGYHYFGSLAGGYWLRGGEKTLTGEGALLLSKPSKQLRSSDCR